MIAPKKILVVDEDVTALFLARSVLERGPVKVAVQTATNGLEAIQMIRTACRQEQCPELLLLEIKMDMMDGFELIDELHKLPDLTLARLQIVLVSNSPCRPKGAPVNNYPALDYIEKPLTIEKVAKFLG